MSLPYGRHIRGRFDDHVAARRIVVDRANAQPTADNPNPAARIQAAAVAEQSWNEPGRKVLWVDAAAVRNRDTTVGLAVVWKDGARPVGEQEWTELTKHSSSKRGAPTGEKEVLGVALDQGEQLFAVGTVGDIVVYSDSAETLSYLLTVCPASDGPATNAVFRAISLADRGFKVEFRLVRGHLSVLGNELANYWAREEIGLRSPYGTDAWAGWLMAHNNILRRPVREQAWRMRLIREQEERSRAEHEEEARMEAEEAKLLEELGL
ncbi:reverse transcriptase from transposon x-element [Neofusicoccum parvum]|nr:reverse transcriptase from transposon x-element [Neofusicoccum parvum]